MRIKKKNVARLASLSALGAGALGVATGTAQASDIVFIPLPPGIVVGWSPGDFKFVYLPLPGTSNFLTVYRGFRRVSSWATWGVIARGSGSVWLKGLGSFLSIAGSGKKWSSATGTTRSLSLAIATRGYKRNYFSNPGSFTSNGATIVPAHQSTTTSFRMNGAGNFFNQYALFQFEAWGNYYYGWLELSSSVFAGSSSFPGSGPDVTVEGYAVDLSGAPIAAGDTGAPEPSTMALTGLAALALGAVGLRRWRAARTLAA